MAESANIRVSGFTLVRNALSLDYPFAESIRSLLPLVDELIINCGDSTDATWELCQNLAEEAGGKITLFKSVWTREAQSGGYQLKHQTDQALARCRGEWCVYLQADEVLHQDDLFRIRDAMERANKIDAIDGILFDYIHFYGSFGYHITGRNWYRREVRAFKNGRGISAFRDAQGFRKLPGETKPRVIASGARVFHYGYVRTPRSLRNKSNEMAQWWGGTPVAESEDLKLHNHVGLRDFTSSHPRVMETRIRQSQLPFDPKNSPRKWNRDEIKNAVTFLWESIVPYRIGEFKNYILDRG